MTTTSAAAVSRRGFLAAAAATGGVLALPTGTKLAFAGPSDPAKGDVLVYVFMRGGADGLSLVPPVGKQSYYDLRIDGGYDITVSQSDALGLGDPDQPDLALHPAMAPLMPWWTAGDMAIVHACGSPASLSSTRSHFEAEEIWERCGTQDSTFSGWVARHLATSADTSGNLAGIAHEQRLWSTMQGYGKALAISNINNFGVFGFADSVAARGALGQMHASSGLLEAEGTDTLAAVTTMDAIDFGSLTRQNGAVYGNSNSFSRELQEIAKLIRADIGLRSVCVDVGGWDSHSDMGPAQPGYAMYDRIAYFANGLAPFLQDLGSDLAEVTVLAVTEFGRTINVNGSGGTDHGRAGVTFAFGQHVNGGIHGGFPSVIEDGPEGDLEVLNDFRQVYAEIVDKRLGNAGNLSYILNGYTPASYLGICN